MITPEAGPLLVTVKEAAKVLSLSTWAVYELCNAGTLDSRYHGRKRLITYASLQAYVAALPSSREGVA